jgi:uncharacterized protein
MPFTVSLISGALFGIGLIVSGMSDPAKVLNFLDVFGTWDPSLAFVMVGALLVTAVGYRLAWRRQKPVLTEKFDLPLRQHIDVRLLTGAALFGVGWGLSGFCPGPAVTSLALLAPGTLIFVPTMLVGMWMARSLIRRT